MKTPSCSIVGSGIAGLTAARVLTARGWQVTILDKGRNPGGRMATRITGDHRWDHGAQFFTARDARFAAELRLWAVLGWIRPWLRERGEVRYCGAEGMQWIARRLAEGLSVRQSVTVARIEPASRGWRIHTQSGETFETLCLILTAPVPQSLQLLGDCAHRLPAEDLAALQSVDYEPCFALLASLDAASRVPAPGWVRPDGAVLDVIADNSQKGISAGAADLTLHATAKFSRTWFEAPREEVAEAMIRAAEPWLGNSRSTWQLHRWKYARARGTLPRPCVAARQPAPVVFAGDGFGGPRVEGAFLSGLAAAEALRGPNE